MVRGSIQPSPNKLRIVFIAGPGDIVTTYRYWREGRDDPSQLHVTFSSQFYDLCKANQIHGYAISTNRRIDADGDHSIRVVNWPHWFANPRGGLFHFQLLMYSLRMVWECVRYKADLVIVGNGTHLIGYGLLRLFGIGLVPMLGCVLWPPDHNLTMAQRAIRWMDAIVYSRFMTAILSVSKDISEQIDLLTRGHHAPIVEFMSSFRETLFDSVAPISLGNQHHIFFSGRMTREKGIFDMLEMARRLRARGRDDIVFHLCGAGVGLEQLQREVVSSGLSDTFRCYGHCNHSEMIRILGLAHFAIVPSRSEMIEGLNQVVVECVLAGRPVITSRVCPAIQYVNGAACVVPPDDIDAYCAAILHMCDDQDFFETKVRACANARSFFYDPQNSWKHAVATVVTAVACQKKPQDKRLCTLPPMETEDAKEIQRVGLGAGI